MHFFFGVAHALRERCDVSKLTLEAISGTVYCMLSFYVNYSIIDMHKLLDLPVLASEHGKDVDNFIIYVHWLMLVLFIGWVSYFAYTLIRFRAKRNPKADYVGVKSHASSYLEVTVALVEAVLLIGFAIPLWAKVVDEYPDPSEATQIRVVAELELDEHCSQRLRGEVEGGGFDRG